MLNARMLIAGGVIAITGLCYLLGFLANLVGQVRHDSVYQMPHDYFDLIKLGFGAAVSILSIGVIGEVKRLLTKRNNGEP